MAGRRTGRLVVLIVLSGLLSPVSSARAAGAAAGDAAYTVICNGDSNTQALAFVSVQENWCELLGEQPGVVTINRGVGASGIVSNGLRTFGVPLWAGFYTAYELAGVDPFYVLSHGAATWGRRPTFDPLPAYDAVILAYGTNDLTAYGYSVSAVFKAIKRTRRRFRRAGADVFVATVPPIFRRDGTPSGDDAVIRELNDRIRRAFPGGYVEFYEGMTYPDDYSDSTHMNAHGHAKRAAAVLRRLLDEAPASPASPPRR
ncbi:SGNH/GDSL hydrolase family protein [Candidatus Binatia bacterium]|nr:SGNH/GDSL hydrolase family protein [Candidatus Binatia bacterium]